MSAIHCRIAQGPLKTRSSFRFLDPKHATFKVVVALLFVSCLASCAPEKRSIFPLKIIRWQCKHSDGSVGCHITTRRYAPDAFEAGLVQEYWDASGNKVNTCSECQEGQGKPVPKQSQASENTPNPDPRATPQSVLDKTWVVGYVEADDEEIMGTIILFPPSLKIAKYKFYFTEPGSSKIISNTVEGTVFESQVQ
jgi:hypothetical protein